MQVMRKKRKREREKPGKKRCGENDISRKRLAQKKEAAEKELSRERDVTSFLPQTKILARPKKIAIDSQEFPGYSPHPPGPLNTPRDHRLRTNLHWDHPVGAFMASLAR